SGEELALAAGTRPSASAHVETRTRSRGRSVDTGSPTFGRRRPRGCPSEQCLVAQRGSVNGFAGSKVKGARLRCSSWEVLTREGKRDVVQRRRGLVPPPHRHRGPHPRRQAWRRPAPLPRQLGVAGADLPVGSIPTQYEQSVAQAVVVATKAVQHFIKAHLGLHDSIDAFAAGRQSGCED